MVRRIREVRDEYRMCRVIGHAWNYTTVKRVGREYQQGLVCSRCTTERYIKINTRTGEASGSRYSYPADYLLSEGGALTPEERSDLRLLEVKTYVRSA